MERAKIYNQSDSQAALNALEGNSFESLLLWFECRDCLHKFGARNRVKFLGIMRELPV